MEKKIPFDILNFAHLIFIRKSKIITKKGLCFHLVPSAEALQLGLETIVSEKHLPLRDRQSQQLLLVTDLYQWLRVWMKFQQLFEEGTTSRKDNFEAPIFTGQGDISEVSVTPQL